MKVLKKRRGIFVPDKIYHLINIRLNSKQRESPFNANGTGIQRQLNLAYYSLTIVNWIDFLATALTVVSYS